MAQKIAINKSGSATDFYTKFTLALYDWWVLGVTCGLVFKCPRSYFVEFYNQNVSNNHLDVGVGSGYFLDKCKFPTSSPRLGLMDINDRCLNYVEKRLKRYRPETYQKDILVPIYTDLQLFDSIGFCGVIHALPGRMQEKVAVFDNLKKMLVPGGRLFGATILYHDVEVGPMAKKLTEIYNKKKILMNEGDRVEMLREKLRNSFSQSEVEIKGAFAIFRATK